MTSEELKKDWEVIEAATPWPWDNRCQNTLDNHARPRLLWSEYGYIGETVGRSAVADAAFIAHARTRWPEALREVERLTQRQLGLEKSLNHLEEFMRRELLEEPDPAYLRVHLDNLIDKFHHAIEHVKIDHVE